MAEIEKYKQARVQVAGPGGGAGDAGMLASARGKLGLADKLSQFSNQMTQIAGEMAQTEGAKAGTKDTFEYKKKLNELLANPDITKEDRDAQIGKLNESFSAKGFGVYSNAYNNAASAAYANQITVDAKDASFQAEQIAQGNPIIFSEAYKKFMDQTVSAAPTPELSLVAQQATAQYGSAGYKKLWKEKIAKDYKINGDKFVAASKLQGEDYLQSVAKGDWAQATIDMGKLTVTMKSGETEGYTNNDEMVLLYKNLTEKGIIQYATDRFNRLEKVDAEQYIKDFKDGNAPMGGLQVDFDEEERAKIADRMEYVLDTMERKRENQAKTKSKFDNRAANDLINAMDSGMDISEENIKTVAKGNISDTTKLNLDRSVKSYAQMRTFKVQNLPTQKAAIDMLESKEDISGDDMFLLNKMKKEYEKDQKLIKDDPLMYGQDNKLFDEPLKPLVFGSKTYEEDLQQRVMQAEQVSTYLNKPVGIFSKEETVGMKSSLANMTPAEKAQFSSQLDQLEGKVGLATYGQLGGTFAIAGTHIKKGVSSNIFEGEELLKNKIYTVPKMTKTDIRNNISIPLEMAGAQVTSDTINAVSAYMAFQAKATGVEVEDVDVIEAIEAVVGETYKGSWFAGTTDTLAPFPGVNEEDFIKWKDNITREDLGGSRETGMTLKQLDYVKNGDFIFAGSGKYMVRVGTDIVTYMDENGNDVPYILEYPRP